MAEPHCSKCCPSKSTVPPPPPYWPFGVFAGMGAVLVVLLLVWLFTLWILHSLFG